jgi:hypothetical protein
LQEEVPSESEDSDSSAKILNFRTHESIQIETIKIFNEYLPENNLNEIAKY